MTETKRQGRPPERVTVIVNFKTALATPPLAEQVVWPKNWPLPQSGDMVRIGGNAGFVSHLTFAPDINTIYINTR